MTIPSFKILKKNAVERVSAAENAGKIVLIYAGTVAVMTALVTAINYALGLKIGQSGGLGNIGLRTMLSTLQTVLPMLQNMLILCLDLGYLAAMLRISRQQYASEKTLKLGFDRFWVMLRYILIQSFLYMLAGLAAFWISMQVYLITPLSNAAIDILTPVVSAPGFTQDTLLALLQDEVFSAQIMSAMLPLFLLFGGAYAVLAIPISYSLRMTNYVIIDKPGQGALYAMKESKKMMRHSRMRLFKLDLSFWWWYAILGVIAALCYGDNILTMVGIPLPWSETVSYFVFLILALMAQFAAWYFLRNRIEVVYAQVYNALKPREKDNGIVLGNIFQM